MYKDIMGVHVRVKGICTQCDKEQDFNKLTFDTRGLDYEALKKYITSQGWTIETKHDFPQWLYCPECAKTLDNEDLI